MKKRNGRSSKGGGRKSGGTGKQKSVARGAKSDDHSSEAGSDQLRRPERSQSKEVSVLTEPQTSKRHRRKQQPDHKPAASPDERPYRVGRGKPPVEHQWKPGYCPNPAGRKKGSKSEEAILDEVLSLKIPMPIAGKIKKVTLREGIYYRMGGDALSGNIRSAAFLLNRSAAIASGDKSSKNMNEDDRAILMDYLRRMKSESEGDE